MTVYRLLEPLQPVLSGRWWWVGASLAAVALALLVRELLPAVRRPRAAACRACGHPFGPGTRFDADPPPRCSECGREERSAAAACRHPPRRGRVAALGLVLLLVALPFAVWHNVHLSVARLALPRWVTTAHAALPGGLRVSRQADPTQEWLGLEPNFADGALLVGWGDPPPATAPSAFVWPERERVLVSKDGGPGVATSYLGPFVFGVEATLPAGRMPAPGVPGFGGDVTGDGTPDLVIGEVNVGSGGGITWFLVDGRDPGPTMVLLGVGSFRPDGGGAWLFDAVCAGFRYRVVPGAFLQDPSVTGSWDPAAHSWAPDAARMRADPDLALLARCIAESRAALRECAASSPGEPCRAPSACPAAAAALSRAVLHLAFTGNAAGWEDWVRVALDAPDLPPGGGAFAEGLVLEVRKAFQMCGCLTVLRQLNGEGFAEEPR